MGNSRKEMEDGSGATDLAQYEIQTVTCALQQGRVKDMARLATLISSA